MAKYCSHTLILPDGSRLDNGVVEVNSAVVDTYYPFMGEVHSTIYVDAPILLSHRADIGGKSISLTQLDWALYDDAGGDGLYAYRLMPCASCAGGRYTLIRL